VAQYHYPIGFDQLIQHTLVDTDPASPTAAVTETIKVINHDGAQTVLQAATDAAKRLNAPCAIAVVDQSGVMMAFDRMDDVRAGRSGPGDREGTSGGTAAASNLEDRG
jgi:hypothetical protein